MYDLHDTGSQMTLLRKLTMEDIGLSGISYKQSCRGMNIDRNVRMEGASLLVRGLMEEEFYSLPQV